MGVWSRSLALINATFKVLREEKMLVGFALLAGFFSIVITGLFGAIAYSIFASNPELASELAREENSSSFILPGLLLTYAYYFVTYTITNFLMTGLIGAALMRIDGKDPVFSDGLKIAFVRLGRIIGYSAVAATVGLILAMLRRQKGLGQLLGAIGGIAWNIATFLVIPVIVVQNLGPISAIKESSRLLKKTWGEQIVGGGGLGIIFFLMFVLVIGGTAGIIHFFGPPAFDLDADLPVLVIGGLAFVLLLAIFTTLNAIYKAMIYAYADRGSVLDGLDEELMQGAFKQSAAASRI